MAVGCLMALRRVAAGEHECGYIFTKARWLSRSNGVAYGWINITGHTHTPMI